jgi:hypothetical protein
MTVRRDEIIVLGRKILPRPRRANLDREVAEFDDNAFVLTPFLRRMRMPEHRHVYDSFRKSSYHQTTMSSREVEPREKVFSRGKRQGDDEDQSE